MHCLASAAFWIVWRKRPCLPGSPVPVPGRWHCLVLLPTSFIVTFLHLSGAFQDCCFQIRNPIRGPLSSASLLCEYVLSQVKASGGGDAFSISH